MTNQNSFLADENLILKEKLKSALQEIADLRRTIQKKDMQISFLKSQKNLPESPHQPSEILSAHSGYFRIGREQQSSPANQLSVSMYAGDLENSGIAQELKESGHSLSFDSTIFDEHRPLINMDFKLPEFNKSRLFGHGKRGEPHHIPVGPITHARMGESHFAEVTQMRRVVQIMQQKGTKDLFKMFIVTGIHNTQPIIQYSFPTETQHAQAILTLLYPQNPLRLKQKTKSMTQINKTLTSTPIRDTFVIPIKQEMSQRVVDEYQYVIGCETEELIFREGHYYAFSRFFCFLSDYKCVKLFVEVLTEIAKNLQTSKQMYVSEAVDDEQELESSLTESTYQTYFKKMVKEQVELKLHRLLSNNKFEYNQHMRVKWSNQKVIQQQIPAKEYESQLIFGYDPIAALHNYRICYCFANQVPYEQNLITFMTVYFICERRLILYSAYKQKVSFALLLLLQLIKPLNFVNPILQGMIRQQYADYLQAPMSIVLCLWGEKRSQKLEVSSRKGSKKSTGMSFADAIQTEKFKMRDGIIVNLDSQKAYGEMDTELNFIITCLTRELAISGEKPAFKSRALNGLLTRMYNNQITAQWGPLLKKRVKQTQMYCYYTQKS